MKKLFLLLTLVTLLFCTATVLCAQTTTGEKETTTSADSSRVDLKTQTLVGKRLDRVEESETGKEYHYIYRVEASPTEQELPRYVVDPQYTVTFTQEGFQEGDTVSLVSANSESGTDSPIWVYEVAYVGSGSRSLTFDTSGSILAPEFAVANSETDPNDPNYHCYVCGHANGASCTAACRCCCSTGNENCNCSGCQYQTPRCFLCPVGCTCSHCVCSCDGCLTQVPRCLACPVGCTCSHCRCQCEISIDHPGRCGCVLCKQRPLECDCECHRDCP